MSEGNFDSFKEKNKEPGVALSELVDIVEPTAQEDIEFFFEAIQDHSPELKEPRAFIVKRIFNRGGVEVAVLTDRDNAQVSQEDVQKFISGLGALNKEVDLSPYLTPGQIAELKARPKEHPLRKVMYGSRGASGAFFYICPTAFLRQKPPAEVITIDELRRRRDGHSMGE